MMDGVEKTMRVMQPYKLASRDFSHEDTVIDVRGVAIGGPEIVVMAGPCSVESREMIIETAHMIKEAGGTILRGGAFQTAQQPLQLPGAGRGRLALLGRGARSDRPADHYRSDEHR